MRGITGNLGSGVPTAGSCWGRGPAALERSGSISSNSTSRAEVPGRSLDPIEQGPDSAPTHVLCCRHYACSEYQWAADLHFHPETIPLKAGSLPGLIRTHSVAECRTVALTHYSSLVASFLIWGKHPSPFIFP